MERGTKRLGRRAGFTLAKAAAAIAVLAVLVALAVPGAAVLRRQLKMTRFNAAARELFQAAQNTLMDLSGDGGTELGSRPAPPEEERLVCVESGGEGMEELLPPGSVAPAVEAGHYMVVYDPDGGLVREVYYAEEPLPASGETLRAGYGVGQSKARWTAEIGFCDGSGPEVSRPLPRPTLWVENGEELRVTVEVEDLPEALWGQVVLAVTVSDGANEVNFGQMVVDAAPFSQSFVLDALEEKQQFYRLCRGLVPGADVRVTAETRCQGGEDGLWLPTSASTVVNSLFASREEERVELACGRHLQNLDLSSSRVDSSIRAAVQTADIDWSASGRESFAPIANPNLTSYEGNGREIRNLAVSANPDSSVAGVGLFGVVAQERAAALSHIRLVNPRVTAEKLPAGALVGRAETGGLRVTDCLVYWDGSGPAADCYVQGKSDAGGLIGSLAEEGSAKISYCGVGLPTLSTDAQSSAQGASIGGLVGDAGRALLTVSNSYAAIDQLAGRACNVAGFVGSAKRAVVSDCYAVGNISARRSVENVERCFISGFLNGGGQVADSYCAMTYLDGEGNARALALNYGFMPASPNTTRAYLAVSSPVKILNEEAGDAEALSYERLRTWRSVTPWTAVDETFSHPYRGALKNQAYPFPGLLAEGDGGPIPHYGSWPDEPVSGGGGLTYYERYSDGTWGHYAVDLETGERSDTLRDNAVSILETGYGVRLPKGTGLESLGKVKIWNFSGDPFQSAREDYPDPGYDLFPFDEGVLAPMRTMVYGWTRRGAEIRFTNGSLFVMNPFFGGAIAMGGDQSRLGTEEIPLQIRTVEQFNNLDHYNPGQGEVLLRQTHDVDFEYRDSLSVSLAYDNLTYDGAGNSLFNRAAPVFQASDGAAVRNVTVRGANIKGASDAGVLMLVNSGRLTNCAVVDSRISGSNVAGLVWRSTEPIENCSFRASRSGEDARVESSGGIAAGLVGDNQSSLTNSRVMDARVYGASAAGLVWKSAASVENCAFRASQGYADARVESSGGIAAGFVGENQGEIRRCYAAGTVVGETASGFAGQAWETTACYANCVVVGETAAAGFALAPDIKAVNCYALLTVEAKNGTAAGFSAAESGEPVFTNCYSAARVSAPDGMEYGFAPLSNTDSVYYLRQEGGLGVGAGQALDYERLAGLFAGDDAWTASVSSATHPYSLSLAGQSYPFPRLAALDHWGDWPKKPSLSPDAESVLGVFHYAVSMQEDGRYAYTVQTSGLAGLPDGQGEPTLLEPFTDPFTVVLDGAPAPGPSGMGVFYSSGFDFEAAGENSGYFYEGAGGIVRLSAESSGNDLGFASGYCFLPISPKEAEDGSWSVELSFRNGGEAKAGDWAYDFTYTYNGAGLRAARA